MVQKLTVEYFCNEKEEIFVAFVINHTALYFDRARKKFDVRFDQEETDKITFGNLPFVDIGKETTRGFVRVDVDVDKEDCWVGEAVLHMEQLKAFKNVTAMFGKEFEPPIYEIQALLYALAEANVFPWIDKARSQFAESRN